MKYSTIVADPPWRYGETRSSDATTPASPVCGCCHGAKYRGRRAKMCECIEPAWLPYSGSGKPLPYSTLSLEEIAALPVEALAEDDAHLYLWTTQRFLESAFRVADRWGFKQTSAVLVWSKRPKGLGKPFVVSAEFVIVARRGSLPYIGSHMGTVFEWARPGDRHSAKPDAFLDIVEQVSPGPYLEMFARRARMGWDYWGNESLNTAEVAAA